MIVSSNSHSTVPSTAHINQQEFPPEENSAHDIKIRGKSIHDLFPSFTSSPLDIAKIDQDGFISTFAKKIHTNWIRTNQEYKKLLDTADLLDKYNQEQLAPEYKAKGIFVGLGIGTSFSKLLKTVFLSKTALLGTKTISLLVNAGIPIFSIAIGYKVAKDVLTTKKPNMGQITRKILSLEKDRVNTIIKDALSEKIRLLRQHGNDYFLPGINSFHIPSYDQVVYEQLEKIENAFNLISTKLNESEVLLGEGGLL